MKCKVCGTEFEGNICPACATPLKDSNNKRELYFYKDPWFWVALLLLICLVFDPLKNYIKVNQNNISSSVLEDTVSVFFADSSSSTPQTSSGFSSIATSKPSTSEAADPTEETSSISKIDITESTVVYVTPSGKRYHLSAACAGENKTETTVKEAVLEDKTPCKICVK